MSHKINNANAAFYLAWINLALFGLFSGYSSLGSMVQNVLGVHPLKVQFLLVMVNLFLAAYSSKNALTSHAAFKSIFAAILSFCLGAVIVIVFFAGRMFG